MVTEVTAQAAASPDALPTNFPDESWQRLWHSDLPVGRSGEWAIERFEIRRDPPPAEALANLGGPPYPPPPRGRYTRLRRGKTVVMTDTPEEWLSHRVAVAEAARRGGQILVTGLGLGLVVEAILRHPIGEVEQVTVLERSPDVVRLVGEHLTYRYGRRVQVVLADAFSWTPHKRMRYTLAWHDLWDTPGSANLASIELLEERYRNFCDWQGAWGLEWCRAPKRDVRDEPTELNPFARQSASGLSARGLEAGAGGAIP